MKKGSADRTARLRVILAAAVISSAIHYTDNIVRIDQYPQPDTITRPVIALAWVIFTAFGALGYVLYRRGRRAPAAICLATFSASGLIGPLHYRSGPFFEFDVFQHLSIVTEALAGIAVLVFASRLMLGRAHATRRGA